MWWRMAASLHPLCFPKAWGKYTDLLHWEIIHLGRTPWKGQTVGKKEAKLPLTSPGAVFSVAAFQYENIMETYTKGILTCHLALVWQLGNKQPQETNQSYTFLSPLNYLCLGWHFKPQLRDFSFLSRQKVQASRNTYLSLCLLRFFQNIKLKVNPVSSNVQWLLYLFIPPETHLQAFKRLLLHNCRLSCLIYLSWPTFWRQASFCSEEFF